MDDDNIMITCQLGGRVRDKDFMNTPDPAEAGVVTDAAFSPQLAGRMAVFILSINILPVEAFHTKMDVEQARANLSGVEDNIVGVQPQDPLPGRPVKRELPRRREVLAPGKLVEAIGILPGDLAGPILRAGIDDDELIDTAVNTF